MVEGEGGGIIGERRVLIPTMRKHRLAIIGGRAECPAGEGWNVGRRGVAHRFPSNSIVVLIIGIASDKKNRRAWMQNNLSVISFMN